VVAAPSRSSSPPRVPPHLRAAYAACERLARDHYENFPVASWLLPAGMRPHVAAVYAFARTADDFADEGRRPAEERLALLQSWRERLWACAAGETTITDDQHAALFTALGHTIAVCHLPVQPFEHLLSAFAQDVTTTRYETWHDVLDYCRRSANPIGRLLLLIAGYRDTRLEAPSDALCTALQLTNFWQDFAIDWERGRLYVPLEEAAAAGADLADLDRTALGPEWKNALARVTGRTRELFAAGRPVCDGVGGRLRYELRVTWLGGTAILDRLAKGGYDPYHQRPTLGATDLPRLIWRALIWRGDPGSAAASLPRT
jgi:hydroxysqualene synthase